MKMLASNFFKALSYVANMFFTIFISLFIMRLALAWAGGDYIFELIYFLTESGVVLTGKILHLPLLQYDIRPLLVVILLIFLKFFIVRSLTDLSNTMEKME